MRSRLGGVVALITGLAASGPAATIAAPLDAPACEQLQARMDALRTSGVETDMAQGPAWAKANLTPDRLQRIGEFMDTEEQLNFRCGLAKQRIVLPNTVEGGEEEIPAPVEATAEGSSGTLPLPRKSPSASKKAAAGKAKTPKSAAIKPAAKPAPVPKASEKKAPGGKAPQVAKQPAEKKAPPKKRAKADDAYRLPPPALAAPSAQQ